MSVGAAMAPNGSEQTRLESRTGSLTVMFFLSVPVLLLCLPLAWSETVTVHPVCSNDVDDCETMELAIKSEKGLAVKLDLVMMSELELAAELCRYYRVSRSHKFGSIRVCENVFSGEFYWNGEMYVLERNEKKQEYDLIKSLDESGSNRALEQFGDSIKFCASDRSDINADNRDDGDDDDEDDGEDRGMGEAGRPAIIEVLVFADFDFMLLMDGNTENAAKYVADVINAVDIIYRAQLDVRVYFAGFREIREKFAQTDEHIHMYLESFTNFYKNMMSSEYGNRTLGHVYGMSDVALLFSNKRLPESDATGTLGVANYAICKNQGTGIVKATKLISGPDNKLRIEQKLASVSWMSHSVAHEIAHTLGASHDEKYARQHHVDCNCSSVNTCLMAAHAPLIASSYTFSECTKEVIRKRLHAGHNGGRLKCLFRQDLLREAGPSLNLAIMVLRSFVGIVSGLMLATAVVLFIQHVVKLPVDVEETH